MKPHFERSILAGGLSREFHFLLMSYAPGLTTSDEFWYHITVMTEEGLLLFRMKQDAHGEWKIDNQAMPGWIFSAEPDLRRSIEDASN
jgi:hypothetical protein